MANKNTITDYFKLLLEILVKCDIVKLESSSGVMHEKKDGVFSPNIQIIGCNGTKDVYLRKTNDESHMTLTQPSQITGGLNKMHQRGIFRSFSYNN